MKELKDMTDVERVKYFYSKGHTLKWLVNNMDMHPMLIFNIMKNIDKQK